MPRRLSLLLLALPLAGCAHHRVALAPPPAPAPVLAEAPPPPPVPRGPTPINANLTPAATVWHLRAGLNVAALACRGADEAAIIAGYNALLQSQKAELAAAQASLSAEYRAGGGDWQDRYDDAMTRLYNFFSQSPARDAFCAAAARVLADAITLQPAALPGFAATRLPDLDAPFAAMLPAPIPAPAAPAMPRPVVALASAPGPALAMAETRAPAPRPLPRLEINLPALTDTP